MKMWNVELVNRGDGPDWSWVGLAGNESEAITRALAHVGGDQHFTIAECEETEEVSYRVEKGELGETLQFKEKKK